MREREVRNFIPYGNCRPSTTDQTNDSHVEAFEQLDRGIQNAKLSKLAREACESCVQLEYCRNQRKTIADELWRRGVRSTVIGGLAVEGHAAKTEIESTTSFEFDIAHLPDDPAMSLLLLRQGLRTKQFSVMRLPNGVAAIGHELAERLTMDDPVLATAFRETVIPLQQNLAFRYISIILCQQADFTRLMKDRPTSRGRKDRYLLDHFDLEKSYPIAKQYIEDTLAIAEMGFRKPAAISIRHSPEFCQKLYERYETRIPRYQFFKLFQNHLLDPLHEIDAFEVRLSLLIKHNEGKLPMTALVKLADVRDTVVGDRPALPKPESVEKTATREAMYKTRNQKNYEALEKRYRNHGFPRTILKHLAWSYNPFEAAEAYLERYNSLLEQARQYPKIHVSRSFLSSYALEHDHPSFMEAAKYYKVRLAYQWAYRRRKNTSQPRLNSSTLRRIADLYGIDELTRVAPSASYLHGEGIVTTAIAETSLFRTLEESSYGDAMCDPLKRQHFTFSGALRALSPGDRLCLAHGFGLARLIYGRDLGAVHIARLLDRQYISDYCDEVFEKCLQILSENEEGDASRPLTVAELWRDLSAMLSANTSPDNLHTILGKKYKNITTIIGGTGMAFGLPERAAEAPVLTPGEQRWLVEAINAYYPPSEQPDAYRSILTAMRDGVLILVPHEDSFGARLNGAFYTAAYDDADRAAVAHARGLDRLLYGKSLSSLLEQHFRTISLPILSDSELPNIPEAVELPLTAVEQAQRDINCTRYALQQLLARSGVRELQYDKYGEVILDPALIARLARRHCPLAPTGWYSRESLLKLSSSYAQVDTEETLKKLPIAADERELYRANHGFPVLDVYYHPHVYERLNYELNKYENAKKIK